MISNCFKRSELEITETMNGESQILSLLPKIGYWWSDKKNRKLKVNDFSQICRQHGFELTKLDLDKPFEEQGPFVAIVHKLSDVIVKAEHGDTHSQAVCATFQEYVNEHPEVVIIDPLPNVAKLLDRYRQYKIIENSVLRTQGDIFVPAFVELTTTNIEENVAKMKAANVTFPCVCKPSLAHGSTLAHQMSLVFNEEGLKDITIPCVAQKFVNHNAILFKLFIIGNQYFVDERPSLKNFYAGEYKTIFFDSHDISKPHSASALNELDESEPKTPPVYPEREKLDRIVQQLCQQVKLALFGIDVIIDNKTGHYAIIDMNVFPGYDGIENIFQILTDLIMGRISLQASNLSPISKPILANVKWTPDLKFPPNRKFTFSSILNGEEKQTVAVVSNNSHCFCCPISGQCHNMMRSMKEMPRDTIKKLDLSSELSVLLHNANLRNEGKPHEVDANKEVVFGSPDSAQDDSGIETSDSCDEKKKGTILKNVKRQHSRCHQTTATMEGSH